MIWLGRRPSAEPSGDSCSVCCSSSRSSARPIGAAGGALVGSLRDVGIDDGFIKEVKGSVTEGTSALFLLSSGGVEDRIRQRFIGTHAELISTNLDAEGEAKLREIFSEN